MNQKASLTRTYTKKPVKVVTDPAVLYALKFMAESVYTYQRNPFLGTTIKDARYAFYFGKINTGGVVGLNTSIILSSNIKVYNISNIDAVVEMNWNQDKQKKGKRGYGHIYLGKLTGDKRFEAYLQPVF